MKKLMASLLCLITCTAYEACAEVYRWTDSAGKVHYSDKKPSEKAEDISAKVKQQNIDTSREEQKKLETIFRKENDADRNYKMQQQQKPVGETRQCQEARNYLKLVDGPVNFHDEDGNAVKVTEVERRKIANDTRNFISENCE